MTMHKVSELEDALLDEAVAKAAGIEIKRYDPADQAWGLYPGAGLIRWLPSTTWELGGRIIERERIDIYSEGDMRFAEFEHPARPDGVQLTYAKGPTMLIAAMRAYVASKLGDEVELP